MAEGAEEVLFAHDAGIAILTLNRPERRNAIAAGIWEQFRARLAAAADLPLRALVVTGAGGCFSAGLDLKPDNPLLARVLPIVGRRDADGARALVEELKGVCDLLAAFPAPTVAAIEGACVGLGLELALACDLRVAASDARFSLPELRLGMVADLGGTVRLGRLVGPGKAALLALTGCSWSGTEAEHHGLVERLCAPGQALEQARTLGAELRAAAPCAVRGALQVLRATPDLDLQDALALETEAGANALLSGELLEALAARQGRRAPAWDA